MATFRYKAMTATGAVIRGTLSADTEAEAIRHIRSDGLIPITAKPDGGNGILAKLHINSKRRTSLRINQLALVTQEMADLLDAGLELDRVLSVVADLRDVRDFRPMLLTVRSRVREGAMLADALAATGAVSKFYVSMVRAGEMGGQLTQTMAKLADYLARTQAIRESVISALIYPVILLVTAALAVIFMLTFVLPSFEPLFANAGQSLPLATQIVIGISKAFRYFWWLGLILAGSGVWAFRNWLAKPGNRSRWDGYVLRIPQLGPLLADIELERLKRTLGTLIASGVPVPDALLLAKDVLWNTQIGAAVAGAAKSLREGESLAHRLSLSGYFPAATLDLVRVGEETGRLEEMLLRQANGDEKRIRHQVDRLIALLVPGLTIVLGIVIAGLIASMLVAILGVNDIAL